MTTWTEAQTADFWQHNRADFAGDKTATLIVKLTKRYISGRVLDVGAGSGALLDLLPNASGIDVAPVRPNIVEASVATIPWRDGSFQTVLATDVLEHLSDEILTSGIREVSRVLSPGGHFIAVTPYKENLKASSVYCPNCKTEFHKWGHVQSFDEYEMAAFLENVGLRVVWFKVLPLGLLAENPRWTRRPFSTIFLMLTKKFANQDKSMIVVARK